MPAQRHRPRASSARTTAIAAAVVALGLGVVGVVIAVVATPRRPVPAVVVSPASPRPPARPKALRVSDLAAAPPGSHVLDVAPPAGGYGAMDPVAQVPWALAIAQGWAEDARLERVDAERVRPDGTVNAADDPQGAVWYRFMSPAHLRDLRERATTSTRAEGVSEIQVRVSEGRPRVLLLQTRAASVRRREAAPPHPSVLPLTRLVPGLQRDVRYAAPFLTGYLVHIEDEGWVWYLSPLSGDSLPRVRATDARPWPYRRVR